MPLIKPVLTLLIASLLTPPALAQTPSCKDFADCLRQSMNATSPVDKVLLASQGLQMWTKSVHQRDHYNLLMIRAEALIQVHLAKADERWLQQAEADYRQMLTLRPQDYLPITGLARIAELRGQLAEADQLYAQAMASGEPLAYLERADSRLRNEHPDLALQDLDAALKRVAELQAAEREVYPQHLLRLHQLRVLALSALQRDTDLGSALKAACVAGDKSACLQSRRRERWIFF